MARRITAPETRRDEKTGKRIALLSFIDSGSYQQHVNTTKDVFLYAAGQNLPGEPVDGLDRLINHQFVVHMDKHDKAIGLDVLPSRLYRSGVVPTSMLGVNTLIVRYDVGGAVATIVQRPFNVRAEHSAAVIEEIDKLIRDDKEITASMRLGNLGRVVNVTDNSVEVRLNKARSRGVETTVDADDIHEEVSADA